MTTITAVQERLNSIVVAMLDKGLVQPDAHYTIRANITGQIYLSWKKRPLDRYDQDSNVYKFFDAKDGAGDALTNAAAFINAIPSHRRPTASARCFWTNFPRRSNSASALASKMASSTRFWT